MLIQQTLDKLEAIGLGGMATALRDQLENAPQYAELSFEDRLGLIVDRETDWRDSRRLATRLKAAKLRYPATVEDLDFRAPRGLDRATILRLAQAGWVLHHQNVVITGATGCGKSFLACALAQAAIRQGYTALYLRTPRLLDDLAVSRGDGRYQRLLAQLQRVMLLVLDDFLLTPATVEQCRDLLEVVEDRAQLRSTMVASQLPSTPGTARWPTPPWPRPSSTASCTRLTASPSRAPRCVDGILRTPRPRGSRRNRHERFSSVERGPTGRPTRPGTRRP